MSRRPTAVTAVGWFWRVGGVVGMVLALPMALWGQDLFGRYWTGPLLWLSPMVLFLWAFLTSLVGLLLGNGILKGRLWARTLVLVYCVVATLIGAWLYRGHPLYWLNLIGNLVFTAIMWLLLFLPDATAFFKPEEMQPV